ncbi:MAG: LamG-like jellyroll fold domain-containing protein, partial [Candidatus Woesearchaeota archaeon]
VLLAPTPDTTTNIFQNYTYNISANITCYGTTGGTCGNISIFARYNISRNASGQWFNSSFTYSNEITMTEPQGRPQNNTHVLINLTIPSGRLSNENGTMLVCNNVQVPFDAYAIETSGGWVTHLEGLAELNFSANEAKTCRLYYDPVVNATEVQPTTTGTFYACRDAYSNCGTPGNITPSNAEYYGSYSNISLPGITCGPYNDYFTHNIWCYFKAPRSGTIEFATSSDDGSELFINGTPAVNNKYCQATTCRRGNSTNLVQSRYYPMRLTYDENAGINDLYAVYDPTSCTTGAPTGNYIDTECYPYYGDSWTITSTISDEQLPTDEIFINISTINGATPFYTTSAQPQYCTLSVGQSCQINWTVNATGPINSLYKINVNATSNISTINKNVTANATIQILRHNRAPNITAVWLNSTNNFINDSDQNLTRHLINVTDPDNDPVKNITDWRRNNASIALLNMPFEGGSNTTWTKDYSILGNNGSVRSATWSSSAGFDQKGAYTFNGINASINLGQPQSLNFTGFANFTISAWVNVASNSGTHRPILCKGDYQYCLKPHTSNYFEFCVYDTTWKCVMSDSIPTPNTWYHVVAQTNGTSLHMFVNGVLQAGTNTHTGISPDPYNVTIGWDGQLAGRYFNGTIDEVQIWNRTLSPEQISALYNNRTDLIVSQELVEGEVWQACVTPNDIRTDGNTACSNNLTIRPKPYILVNFTTPTPQNDTYTLNRTVQINFTITSTGSLAKFVYNWNDTNYTVLNDSLRLMYNFQNLTALGENSTTIADLSRYGNTGTAYGGATWTGIGKYGGAYQLNGYNGYIDAGSDNSLNIIGELTLLAWINPAQLGRDQKIIARQNGTSGGYKLGVFTNDKVEMEIRNAANGATLNRGVAGGTVLQTNNWYCVAGVYSQSGGYLATYVNGEIDRNLSTAEILGPTTGSLIIGREAFSSSYYFNGTIDEVQVWSKAMTPDELREQCMYSLQRLNLTAWYFQVNQSLNSTTELDFGDYNYSACGTDFKGNTNCTLTQIIHIRPRNTSNLTIVKTDIPDPVNVSSNLTYVINVTSTGPGRAYNVSVNDTYPLQVIYLTSQPTPLTGTNNTWLLGNLTANQSVLINITVLTLNVTNGTIINNTVNVSFNNETGALINRSTTTNTTVIAPIVAVFNFSNISVTKTDNPDPVNKSSNLTYVINVTSNGNGTAYNVTVNDTYPLQVIYLTSSPAPLAGTNNTWIIGNLTNGTSVLINITVLTLNVTNGTIINNTANVSFQNETGIRINTSTTINTTVTNRPPSIAQVILNTTNPLTNYTDENLTAYFINVTDPDDDPVKNITDWRVNNLSIAVLNMPFEDDSSTTWTKDYSTYGNNGTVINATWLSRGGYDGWGAYDFNGINTSIITTNDTSLNLTYQVTLTAWVKLHTFKNWMRIVAKATDYNAPPFTIYGLLLDNAGHARMEIASGGVQNAVNGNTTLPIEQWVFLAATYDNTTMKLYVNGLLDNSTPLTGAIDTNNRPVSIGSSAYTPGPDTIINATIDEVIIYNRALTEEQIMLLYLNKTAIISSQETKNDEIWQVCATPNDKLADGNTVCSNYVAIKKRYNFTNISITKTDNPDPVNKSSNLTYVINVTSNGNGTAYNVTVNDTYPQ